MSDVTDAEIAPSSPGDRPARGYRAPAQRSRVSNGSELLPGIDGRSREARRYRDVLDALILEHDITTEADMCLAREIAHLRLWLEMEAARTARGEATDIELVTRTANSVRRMQDNLAVSLKARQRAARKNTP